MDAYTGTPAVPLAAAREVYRKPLAPTLLKRSGIGGTQSACAEGNPPRLAGPARRGHGEHGVTHPVSSRRGAARFPDVGIIFRVSLFTERRVGHLRPLPVARTVVRALRASDDEALSDTLAYAILPDQVQWLFVLGDFTTLAAVAKKVKARCEAELAARLMLPGPLWQPAFAEERISDQSAAERVAEAMLQAPLEAGHAATHAAWPHWDTRLTSVFARLAARV